MANTLTPLAIVNRALRELGHSPITAFTETTREAEICRELWPSVRDALNGEHPWNFATRRTILRAWLEPPTTLTPGATTGTGVPFTAGATDTFGLDALDRRLVAVPGPGQATITGLVATTGPVSLTPDAAAATPGQTGVTFTAATATFASTDVGRLIDRLDGPGAALITAYLSVTQVQATIREAFDPVATIPSGQWRLVRTDQVLADIDVAFASVAPIAAGQWRLYWPAPAWGYQWSLGVPDDALRIFRAEDSAEYQREGDVVVADREELPVVYIRQVTDVTRYPPWYVEVLVTALRAALAEPITGQIAKQQLALQQFEAQLRRAKIRDGQEGAALEVAAPDLWLARRGVRRPRSR
ncbi:MAG TPA: hypothetical protein VNK50_13105 [Calidithermus sp.]|nr:hypothetical protein [Calidithermus sp.]